MTAKKRGRVSRGPALPKIRTIFDSAFRRLVEHFGPQGWWPGDTPEEVLIGAVLTQNTNWENVERALANLKGADALSLKAIDRMSAEKLAALIRPSGYFNLKAGRLKSVVRFFIGRSGGDLKNLRALTGEAAQRLRAEALECYGMGPETVDSILLYALDLPTFVIDAYTMRFLRRHGLLGAKADYAEAQALFHRAYRRKVGFYNEFHALFVALGKAYCRTNPVCAACPLMEAECFATKKTFAGMKRAVAETEAKARDVAELASEGIREKAKGREEKKRRRSAGSSQSGSIR
ncbi:MAG: endonuclease III domain-containing protein [bacterium]